MYEMNGKSWRTCEPRREEIREPGQQKSWRERPNNRPQPSYNRNDPPPLPKSSCIPRTPTSVQRGPKCWICGGNTKVSASDVEHVSRSISDYRNQTGTLEEWIIKKTGKKLECCECQGLFDGTIRWSDLRA